MEIITKNEQLCVQSFKKINIKYAYPMYDFILLFYALTTPYPNASDKWAKLRIPIARNFSMVNISFETAKRRIRPRASCR